MEKNHFVMDDFDFGGKTVLVRADLNSPINPQTRQAEDSPRISAHALTIKELSLKGAKVVVLAHQGRKGDEDFISLQGHALLLEQHMGINVEFVPGLADDSVLEKIKSLQPGQVLLLENTRFGVGESEKLAAQEDYAGVGFVKTLSSVSDHFINDAFSVSHRSQASVVGFPFLLPSAAGRVMQKEIAGAERAASQGERPVVYLLGGAKPDDVFGLLAYACDSGRVDKILTSGVLGNLCLLARGIDIGAKTIHEYDSKGFLQSIPKIKEYAEKYPSKIEAPVDLAVDEHGQRQEYMVGGTSALPLPGLPALDIGSRTIARYSEIISTAKTIYLKGPLGVYENPVFEKGTREVFKAIAASKAYTICGGGHSTSAMQKFNIPISSISHVSLSGGALVDFLEGKKLPGVEALKVSYQRFKK